MEVSSTEKRSTSGGRTETLAWPDDHDFIEISKYGQDQAISVLQYDYHTKIIQGGIWTTLVDAVQACGNGFQTGSGINSKKSINGIKNMAIADYSTN